MKREHLMLVGGGGLIVLAILVVVLSGPDDPEPQVPSGKDPVVEKRPARPPSTTRPPVAREAGSAVSSNEFVEEFGALGFNLTENDRGAVSIATPAGAFLAGETIVTAPGGDGFYLQGTPSMQTGNTTYRTRDGEGYLHIKQDGSIVFSPGNWETMTEE